MGIFSKQKNIIFISQSRLRAAQVDLRHEGKINVIEDTAWNHETLPSLLSSIHTKIGSNVRIVLGEDLAYVVSFALKNSTKYTRLTIKEEAAGFIPENLDEVAWDFQSISAIVGDKRIGISKGVQVAAVSKVFLHDIAPIFVGAGFVVEALETESCALARLMHQEEQPLLIVHMDHKRTLLVILERGVVMATESFPVSVSSDHIEKLIISSNKHFLLRIRTIIFSEEAAKEMTEVHKALQGKGFSVREVSLDPVVGIAQKTDISGDDAKVLNVNILPQGKGKIIGSSLSPSEKRLLVVFLFSLGLGLFCVAGIMIFKKLSHNETSKTSQMIPVAPSMDLSENKAPSVPSEAEFVAVQDISAYTIKVLNGSGRKGEASTVQKLLQALGATNVRIGDADSRSVKTVIRAKKSISEPLLRMLSQDILNAYVIDDFKTLDDAVEDDIIVIVGSQKNE